MEERSRVYFVADVHLGLKKGDPAGREERFISFLDGIDRKTTGAVCLLGDIWDFWYEYRDVIPREAFRTLCAIERLIDAGIEVYFIPGNHDLWSYGFLAEAGIKQLEQPTRLNFGGRSFCIGHGHGLGPTPIGYRIMLGCFRSRLLQALFSSLHPRIAFWLGHGWSDKNRDRHLPYSWKGADEPLHKYSEELLKKSHADYFIFGHYHVGVREPLSGGAELIVLKDWLDGGCPCAVFDGQTLQTVF